MIITLKSIKLNIIKLILNITYILTISSLLSNMYILLNFRANLWDFCINFLRTKAVMRFDNFLLMMKLPKQLKIHDLISWVKLAKQPKYSLLFLILTT